MMMATTAISQWGAMPTAIRVTMAIIPMPSAAAQRRRTAARSREVATVSTSAPPSTATATARDQSAAGAAIKNTVVTNVSASTAG